MWLRQASAFGAPHGLVSRQWLRQGGCPVSLGALLGQDLDRVDELLTLVVALAGVLLGALVGPYRAGPLQHGGEA